MHKSDALVTSKSNSYEKVLAAVMNRSMKQERVEKPLTDRVLTGLLSVSGKITKVTETPRTGPKGQAFVSTGIVFQVYEILGWDPIKKGKKTAEDDSTQDAQDPGKLGKKNIYADQKPDITESGAFYACGAQIRVGETLYLSGINVGRVALGFATLTRVHPAGEKRDSIPKAFWFEYGSVIESNVSDTELYSVMKSWQNSLIETERKSSEPYFGFMQVCSRNDPGFVVQDGRVLFSRAVVKCVNPEKFVYEDNAKKKWPSLELELMVNQLQMNQENFEEILFKVSIYSQYLEIFGFTEEVDKWQKIAPLLFSDSLKTSFGFIYRVDPTYQDAKTHIAAPVLSAKTVQLLAPVDEMYSQFGFPVTLDAVKDAGTEPTGNTVIVNLSVTKFKSRLEENPDQYKCVCIVASTYFQTLEPEEREALTPEVGTELYKIIDNKSQHKAVYTKFSKNPNGVTEAEKHAGRIYSHSGDLVYSLFAIQIRDPIANKKVVETAQRLKKFIEGSRSYLNPPDFEYTPESTPMLTSGDPNLNEDPAQPELTKEFIEYDPQISQDHGVEEEEPPRKAIKKSKIEHLEEPHASPVSEQQPEEEGESDAKATRSNRKKASTHKKKAQ
jgi:hypothetical protein